MSGPVLWMWYSISTPYLRDISIEGTNVIIVWLNSILFKLLSSNFWTFNNVIEETITIFRKKKLKTYKPKLLGIFSLKN